MSKLFCAYILTNRHHTVLYTGVTGDLKARVHQHREKLLPGFAKRYNVDKLVYYDVADHPSAAIAREKQVKAGSRRKKIELIKAMNAQWRDLYDELSIMPTALVIARRASAEAISRSCVRSAEIASLRSQ